MRPLLILAILLATPARSGPVFTDRSDGLPVAHIYGGGWEHFVGGGVAVLDCDGDALLVPSGVDFASRYFLAQNRLRNPPDPEFATGNAVTVLGGGA